MLSADETRAETVAAYLTICVALTATGVELAAIERQYGIHGDISEVRGQCQQLCGTVLERLRILLLKTDPETVLKRAAPDDCRRDRKGRPARRDCPVVL